MRHHQIPTGLEECNAGMGIDIGDHIIVRYMTILFNYYSFWQLKLLIARIANVRMTEQLFNFPKRFLKMPQM